MKIKEWIRTKLTQFLLIDEAQEHTLSEINRLDKKICNTDKRLDKTIESLYTETRWLGNSISKVSKDCNIVKNTLHNVVSVGADIGRGNDNRSWAVVCIEGNYNVVKFYDLHGQDYRTMLDFLKQFEGSRMCIDAPRECMFENDFRLK